MKKKVFFAGLSGAALVFAFAFALAFAMTALGCGPLPDTEYTVSFDADGGSVTPKSETVESGKTVDSLPTPTKEGYTFGGWYTAQNGGGMEFTTTTPVTANITVYALWTAVVQYTVSFNAGGGTVEPASAAVISGGALSSLPTPTKEGYTFGGWYTAQNGGGTEFTTTTPVTADITVYALWTADVPTGPTVTSVTVSPGSATMSPGSNRTFTATVQGTGNPDQTLTWSVEGGASGTTITSEGILTVGADETASSLTVRATSTYDTAKSGTAAVTVVGPGQGTVTLIYPETEDVAAGAFSDTAITLSKDGAKKQHTLTVSGDYDTCQWRVDGTIKADSNSIDLDAADYPAGKHQISVEVTRNGAAYSKAGSFTVEE